MGRAYSDIAFTPTVRDWQTRKGSRAQYAAFDEATDRADFLTPREIDFIAKRDHFFQATVSETGWPYVQHRGGAMGFLRVLDPKTLGFADFHGNVQYLSAGNLQKDDRISIILLDYANRRRLKILGRARTVEAEEDPDLMQRLAMPGFTAPIERAFLISVEAYDWNCPKYIVPRYTEAEIEAVVAPLQEQLNRARIQLAAQAGHAQPTVLGDGPLALRVSAVRELTPRVRAYRLAAASGAALPEVAPGAHIEVPVRLPDGAAAVRHYSIVEVGPGGRWYEIAVLREGDGRGGSKGVHADYAIGLELRCGLPRNHYPLHTDARSATLIAGGIGITPVRAMARALTARGTRLRLHYAVRSRSEAPYLEELEAELGASLVVYAADEGARLDAAVALEGAGHDVVYVCGPGRLIDAVRSAARAQGLPDESVRFERFGPAERDASGDRPVTVELARSGRRIQVPAGSTILDALEAEGVKAPASCRIGNCGTCAVQVLAGEPEHRDEALSEAERQAGRMCICISRAKGDALTLEL